MTSQNTALANHRFALPTLTKSMGLPAMEERPIATVACVSHTKTSACSCGGRVRTLLVVKYVVL